jgi:hypothetical protein
MPQPHTWTVSRAFAFILSIVFGALAAAVWFNTSPHQVLATVGLTTTAVVLLMCSLFASDVVCEFVTLWIFT